MARPSPPHKVLGLLAVAVVVLMIFKIFNIWQTAGRIVGYNLEVAPDGMSVLSVVANGPANVAGVAPGDLITAINGGSVRSFDDYHRQARTLSRGRPSVLSIRRGESQLTIEIRPGQPLPWSRLLFDLAVFLGYLGIGLLAMQRAPTDLRSRILATFSIAVAAEIGLPTFSFGPRPLVALSTAMFFLLSGIQMGLELHLASVIPHLQEWLRGRGWVIRLYYAAGIAFGLTGAVTFLLEAANPAFLAWSGADVLWVFDIFILPAWGIGVLALLANQALQYPEPQGRHQAGLVFLGVLPWALYSIVLTVSKSFFGAWTAPLQSLAILCYPVAVFFAIFLFRLFDIELVVRRGMVYTALAGALIAAFYGILGIASVLLARSTGSTSSVWIVSGATLLIGLLASPLRGAVQRGIDRRFFPERYALRDRLITLASELTAFGSLPRMGAHLATRIRDIFETTSATVLIADPETRILSILASTHGKPSDSDDDQLILVSTDDAAVRYLERTGRPAVAASLREKSTILAGHLHSLDTRLAVPVLRNESLVGLILIGDKITGERFAAEEIELLALLSHQAATTFENARLFEHATYESLTGLLRREAILQQLERELERALRYGRPIAIAMADLDHFKAVNDRHGHLTGDAVLQRVAHAMTSCLRSTDMVGRYGGEEFLIVLPETNDRAALRVAEKVRGRVEKLKLRANDGSPITITISIGLACVVEPEAAPTATALIDIADQNLFAAKNAGRNCIRPQA